MKANVPEIAYVSAPRCFIEHLLRIFNAISTILNNGTESRVEDFDRTARQSPSHVIHQAQSTNS